MTTAAPASEPTARPPWLRLSILVVAFAGIMLLCVRQWGSSHPWSRLDLFSGGYVVLSLTLLVQQSVFAVRSIPTEQIRRLFYSLDIDPGFERWTMGLGLAELAVFLDYGQWHLVPALDHTASKTAGLILYVLTVAWLFHVDRFLHRNFAAAQEHGVLMTSGPYRLVRHPRYSGLISTRICFALLLASPIAWCLCVLWIAVVLRRIHREEHYLRARFPSAYDQYAAATPQLIPLPGVRP